MDLTGKCAALLAQCISIMELLGLLREHLRPVPMTLTALATECFLMHQALRRVHRDILKPPNEIADHELLQSLDAFLLGCTITMCAAEGSANEMCQAMGSASPQDTPELSAKEDVRLQQLWQEERMNQFRLQLMAYRKSLPDSYIGDLIETAENEQSRRLDVDSNIILGTANHRRLSFEVRPSSRNTSGQGSILDPPPLYALSLHSVTRGYEYSARVFQAPQGPRHRLGDIRLIAHDPEDERATSFLGYATEYLDLVDLSKATPAQIQQLQLQSTIIVSQETLRSTVAATRHQDLYEKEFAARPQSRKFSKNFKVVVAGAGGVDKSALVIQFIQSHFVDGFDPTKEDSYRKAITVDGIPAVVDVLDTAGQEEYASMREQYMKTGEGFVLVYSITSRESFKEILELYEQISSVRKMKAWPRVLVANHCDRESDRQVSELEGREMAKQLECAFFEASPTIRINVDSVFEALVREIRYHDAVGTSQCSPGLNPPRSLPGDQDSTLNRTDEGPEHIDRLLQEEAKPNRSNNYFRRRLRRPAESNFL